MVNHVRTTLLNMSAQRAGVSSGFVGAAYIPPGFVPLGDDLVAPYAPLFPFLLLRDTQARLYTVNALMSLVHLPALEAWAAEKDPRITYTPGALPAAPLAGLLQAYAEPAARRVSEDLRSYAASLNDGYASLWSLDPVIRLGAAALACATRLEQGG